MICIPKTLWHKLKENSYALRGIKTCKSQNQTSDPSDLNVALVKYKNIRRKLLAFTKNYSLEVSLIFDNMLFILKRQCQNLHSTFNGSLKVLCKFHADTG